MKNSEHKDLFAQSIRRLGNTIMTVIIGVIILLIVIQLPETVEPYSGRTEFQKNG